MAGKAPFIQLKFHFSLSFFPLCGNYWMSFQWTLIVILFCMCQGLCYGLATPKGPKHHTGGVTTDLKPKHFFFHFSGFCFAKKGLLSPGTKWTDVQQVNRIIFPPQLLCQLCHTVGDLHLLNSCFCQFRTKLFLCLYCGATHLVMEVLWHSVWRQMHSSFWKPVC